MPDCSLPRTERLRSLGAVRRMFESGESGFIFPFRYVWFAEADEIPSAEVLFSVPKKFHKRANKRNLLRRRTKDRPTHAPPVSPNITRRRPTGCKSCCCTTAGRSISIWR